MTRSPPGRPGSDRPRPRSAEELGIPLPHERRLIEVLVARDIGFKVRLARYGGHGWAHILRRIVPRVQRTGLRGAVA